MAELYTDQSGERTEMPTPLRLAEARRRGNIPRSSDLASAVLLLGATWGLTLVGPRLMDALRQMTAAVLDGGPSPVCAPAEAGALLWGNLVGVLSPLSAVWLVAVLVAVAANVLQVGFVAVGERIRPDLGRLSPASGLRRIVSKRSVVRLTLAMAKVIAGVVVFAVVVGGSWQRIWAAAGAEAREMAGIVGDLLCCFAIRLGFVLLALGGVDYLCQRWQHREDLKITRRELLEDLRRAEGHPQVRGRRRRIAREGSARGLTAGVPRASAVVVAAGGPAAAIRYERSMRAPRVIAKAVGPQADLIRSTAKRAGVPVVEDDSLARDLHAHCGVGMAVPRRFYGSLADVLARAARAAKNNRRQGENA